MVAPLGSSAFPFQPVVWLGRVLVAEYGTGTLKAFDAAGTTSCSGSPVVCTPEWTKTFAGLYGPPAAAVDGRLFISIRTNSNVNKVVVYDEYGGAVNQSAGLGGTQLSAPALSGAAVGCAVAVSRWDAGSSSAAVIVLDSGSLGGFASWTSTPLGGADPPSAPAVTTKGVYVANGAGLLLAFKLAGCGTSPCDPVWTSQTLGSGNSVAPIVANNLVLHAANAAADSRNLAQIYAFDVAGNQGCSGSPVVCTPLASLVRGFTGQNGSAGFPGGMIEAGRVVHRVGETAGPRSWPEPSPRGRVVTFGDGTGEKPVSDPRPVLVVDFGAQYAQLIARRVRECHVYSEIVPFDVAPDELEARRPAGLILSGGPASVYEPGAPALHPAFLDLGVPVLGICYGQQAMAQVLGGRVEHTGLREYGRTLLTVQDPGTLLGDLPEQETVWMSHGDAVSAAPPGFRVTARTDSIPVAAMEDVERGLYGVQFHPEVAHTPRGMDVLKRFLYDACGLLPEWTPANVIERAVERIRHQVGDAEVLCALSGGVDSSVAALLVYKAIGKNLTCVFVDHGLVREGEAEQVVQTFGDHFHVPLIHLDRSELFLSKLAGVTDPERKRKIIGEQFIRSFEEVARTEGRDARFLVQGTLYPDVIESGSRTAAKIKSHHNVGGLPDDMDFELVEPLRDLFKDEVRKVGEELGLPQEIVWRQPFPGPGLAVRIVGEVTRERLAAVRAADRIVQEEVRRAGLSHELWQAFAVLLAGVQSVGVMGDGRTYENPVVIRAVTSEDAMTADWARLPYDVLDRIASRVVAEVPGVNRVAFDITSKPPGTIEWE